MRSSFVFLLFFVVCALSTTVAVAQDSIVLPQKKQLPEVSLAAPQKPAPLPVLPVANEDTDLAGEPSPARPEAKHGLSVRPASAPGIPPAPSKSASVTRPSVAKRVPAEDLEEEKITPGMTLAPPMVVLPEVTTTVQLSASDLNRVICPDGDIKEAITSDEKGLMIKITGKDAFLKFKVGKRSDGKLSYSTTPTEIYMVCGGSTYSMIAFPGRMPSQTIKLSSGMESRVKENQSLYAGLPFEKRVMRAIKEVYTDNIPESYTVTRLNQVDVSWKGLIVTMKRDVDIEGEGMRIKEYHVVLKPGQRPMKLSEKMFLRKEFALNPIAVSIDKHNLKPGEVSRLFIVEQRPDRPLGSTGFGLSAADGEFAPSSAAPAETPQAKPPQAGVASSLSGRPGAVPKGVR